MIMLQCDPKLKTQLPVAYRFEAFMALQGITIRQTTSRRTLRIHLANQLFFAKLHYGIGWREIIKNLFFLRLPIINALTEWRALQRVAQLGIAAPKAIAVGVKGCNPARQQSFILLEALENTISLETICAQWKTHPPHIAFKRSLITRIASIARQLHLHGINHRDFYLCHFLLPANVAQSAAITAQTPLFLIDWHRAQLRRKVPYRWRVKDLSGLYYSALETGLTKRDLYRFIRVYTGKALKVVLVEEAGFWQDVAKRALKLYEKFKGKNSDVAGHPKRS